MGIYFGVPISATLPAGVPASSSSSRPMPARSVPDSANTHGDQSAQRRTRFCERTTWGGGSDRVPQRNMVRTRFCAGRSELRMWIDQAWTAWESADRGTKKNSLRTRFCVPRGSAGRGGANAYPFLRGNGPESRRLTEAMRTRFCERWPGGLSPRGATLRTRFCEANRSRRPAARAQGWRAKRRKRGGKKEEETHVAP